MKTSERMTADVLKRRDEEIKAKKPLMIRRITTIAVPCAAALAVTAVTAASIHSIVGDHRGNNIVDRGYMGGFRTQGTAENGELAASYSYSQDYCTSYSENELAAITSEPQWFLKNPNAGRYAFRTVVSEHIIGDLKSIESSPDYNELSDPKYTFTPYPANALSKYYLMDFDRFSRLHSEWSVSNDRPLGVYYLEESNAMTTSIELKCDTNTLNYITPDGAKISVTAQRGRFIPESVSSTSVERPRPEVNIIYDENGNELGAFTQGYDPGNTGIGSGKDDSIVTYIYTNPGETKFLAYIDMGTWVKIYAEGLSGIDEFKDLIEEFTK